MGTNVQFGTIRAESGSLREFTAPDANVDQTVTITERGLPAFATLDQTPGNPAAGTLTFTSTADRVGSAFGFNIDATDDDPEVPFTDSEFVEVTVVAPDPTSTTAPAAQPDGELVGLEPTTCRRFSRRSELRGSGSNRRPTD